MKDYLLREWDYEKNGDLDPNKVADHSNKQYYWICDKGHSFLLSPDRRSRGQNCYYCSNRRLLVGFNDLATRYPLYAAEWDYSENEGNPDQYTISSTYYASWICSVCGHRWHAKIRDRVNSKCGGCKVCGRKKRGLAKHEHELKKRGGITDPLLLSEWDYEKNEKGPEQYTPKSQDTVSWICSKCGYHYPAKIGNRAFGRGCPCCAGKIVVPGINDLATTHPKLAAEWHPTLNGDLKPTDVSYGLADEVWWLCPEGHSYPASLNHRSTGTNCPICNSGRQTSFAEQAVFFYVKKVFPDAISRYTDIFDNSMELDIYIPSIKLAIEYDGEAWHKKDKIEREKKKYQICQQHGIRLLRLMEKAPETGALRQRADESISIGDGPMYEKKNLRKVIQFLLDEIDPETNKWTRKKPIIHSRVDIDLDRDEAEIRKYMTKLKKGSLADEYPALAAEWHPTKNGDLTPDKVKPHSDIKVWWCCPDCGYEYPATVGHRVSGTGCRKCGHKKTAQSGMKPVAMLDSSTLEEIKRFSSISEAASELGISLSNIVSACKGQRKRAGGYSWKYLEKEDS